MTEFDFMLADMRRQVINLRHAVSIRRILTLDQMEAIARTTTGWAEQLEEWEREANKVVPFPGRSVRTEGPNDAA